MKISLAQIEAELDKLGIKLIDKHLLDPEQDNFRLDLALKEVLRRSLPMDDRGDSIFSYFQFVMAHGRPPTTEMIFNDVMHRKKVSADLHDPLVALYTDKELAKILIVEKLGREHVIPTIDILHSDMEIDNYSFPDRCVVKPTHSSGRVVSKKIDDEVPVAQLKSWLRHNFYEQTREKNYRYLEPKIIVEPDLYEDPKMAEIKVFCFRGKAKTVIAMYIADNQRTSRHYTVAWDDLNCSTTISTTPHLMKKPRNFDAMTNAAELLAHDFEFVRVDILASPQNPKFLVGDDAKIIGDGVAPVAPLFR